VTPAFDYPIMPQILTQKLREAIIFGEVMPNTRLTEEYIAELFHVSRSPARDALRRLEADGLIRREDRRGARVAAISQRDLDEVYRCRIPLEGLAASEAAVRRTSEQLAQLETYMKTMEAASGDTMAYFQANVVFTDAVHAASDNVTVRRLLGGIGLQALRYRFLAYRKFPDLINLSVEGNKELMDALQRSDSKQARAIMESLIERSWLTIREAFTEPAVTDSPAAMGLGIPDNSADTGHARAGLAGGANTLFEG